jgi:hypothetical protein
MKITKDNLILIWVFSILISIFVYTIYVVETADHKPGCSYDQNLCVSSHLEESTHWQGGFGKMPGHWVTTEAEVCDDWETVTVDCDCITYHWFWGDYKNYNESNEVI